MRDWKSGGQDYDTRTLDELRWMVLRVSCKSCRHMNVLYPIDLKRHLGPRDRWTNAIPKLKCSVCNEKNAMVETLPLPRN